MLDLLKELRSRGKAIIQDFDDNIHTMNPDNEAGKVYSNGKPATKIFEQSLPLDGPRYNLDAARLVDDYRKFGGTYKVFAETSCRLKSFDRLAPSSHHRGAQAYHGEIRAGYAGSSSHRIGLDASGQAASGKSANGVPAGEAGVLRCRP